MYKNIIFCDDNPYLVGEKLDNNSISEAYNGIWKNEIEKDVQESELYVLCLDPKTELSIHENIHLVNCNLYRWQSDCQKWVNIKNHTITKIMSDKNGPFSNDSSTLICLDYSWKEEFPEKTRDCDIVRDCILKQYKNKAPNKAPRIIIYTKASYDRAQNLVYDKFEEGMKKGTLCETAYVMSESEQVSKIRAIFTKAKAMENTDEKH